MYKGDPSKNLGPQPPEPSYAYFGIEFYGEGFSSMLKNQMCIIRGEKDTKVGDMKTYLTNILNITNFVTDDRKLEESLAKIGKQSGCN